MILKVFADPGNVVFDRDPMIAQLLRRTNPRQFHDLGRANRPGRQDNFAVRRHMADFAKPLIVNATHNPTINIEAGHGGLGQNVKVGTRHGRF